MSFSQQDVVAAITLALLLLTAHLAAGAEEETIAPLDTMEVPTSIPCFGKHSICIGACVLMHYTGGYCAGTNCVCTKPQPLLAEAETEAAGGPSSQLPVEPPLAKGMLN